MIVPTLARLLVREHLYKPIQGKVLTLGRQTICMTYGEVMELLQQEGYTPPQQVLEGITIARDQKTRVGKGTYYITDKVFFGLLGVKELITMDVSSYEATDIVHDLNKPVPDSLHERFDFIIDGGTFDHLFDIRMAFENVVKMLKCGGRIFQWNAASNFTGAAYISFGPDLFYDYYVLNQFTDCKVYVVEVNSIGQREMWEFYQFEGTDQYSHFRSSRPQMVVVLAEKGPFSTGDKMPIQGQYRDTHLWQSYRTVQKMILSSARKPWTGSRFGYKLAKFKRGVKTRGVKTLMCEFISKMKEKGVVWCFKRSVSKAAKYLYSFLKRRTKIAKGKELEGYRYVGKI